MESWVKANDHLNARIQLASGAHPGPGSYFISGHSGGQPLQILLDSGCQLSCVSRAIYEQIPVNLRPPLEPSVLSLTGLMSPDLPIHGVSVMEVKIKNQKGCQPIVINEALDKEGIDMLLGSDFMETHKLHLECYNNRICFRGSYYPTYRASQSHTKGRLRLKQTVTLPPNSEWAVPVSLDGNPPEDVLHASMVPDWPHKGIIMPTGLFDIRQPGMKITLRNTTAAPIVVHNKETVAILGEISKCQEVNFKAGDVARVNFLQACINKLEVSETEVIPPAEEPTPDAKLTHEDVLDLLPTHMRCMCEHFHETLTPIEAYQAVQVLLDLEPVFKHPDEKLGRTDLVYHKIDVEGHRPIKQRTRRLPVHKHAEVKKLLGEMLDQGIITPSDSPWASPIVLVTKKDGTTRFCIDYRLLNDITRKDAYPLPRQEDIMDSLAGAKYFCTLDLASGFWQVEMDPEDKATTAFTTMWGLYQFEVMPFGLTNAPATFERLTERILGNMNWTEALVYIDDVVVFGRTFTECLVRLKEIFKRFLDHKLTFKPKKCDLFKEKVELLGHYVSADGIWCDPKKISRLSDWEQPTTVTEVKSFLGLANYYAKFIPRMADNAAPIIKLTTKGHSFVWTADCQKGFEYIKAALEEDPCLAYPDISKPFILDSDASNLGAGAVLSQVQDDGYERPIAYYNKQFSAAERNYCTTKRELLAAIFSCEQFKHYLLGRKFLLRVDHHSLLWLTNFKDPNGLLARWLIRLAPFDYDMVYRKGSEHGNADGLSRVKLNREKGERLCQFVLCPNCAPKRSEKEIVTLKEDLDMAKLQASLGKVARVSVVRRSLRLNPAGQSDFQPHTNGQTEPPCKKEGEARQQSIPEEDIPPLRRSKRLEESKQVAIEPETIPVITPKTKRHYSGWKLKKGALDTVVDDAPSGDDPVGGVSNNPELFERPLLHPSEIEGESDATSVVDEEPNSLNSEQAPLGECNWLDNYSREDLKAKQKEDPQLVQVLTWLERGVRPPSRDLLSWPPVVRALYQQWDALILEHGVMYRVPTKFNGVAYKQFVVPRPMRKDIFKSLHSNLMSGHVGRVKTVEAVRQRFYWPGFRNHLDLWVSQCDVCGENCTMKPKRVPLKQKRVAAPFDVIAFDIVTVVPTEKGNKCFLMVLDSFTRWAEAYALPNHKAETVAAKLCEEWICRYGVPRVMHSDRGPEFTSGVMNSVYDLLEIKKTKTPAYRPQGNSQCERINKTCCLMLRAFADKYKTEQWDDYLPYVMSAYRRSVHESTRLTPNLMLYGRDCNLPIDLVVGSPPETPECPIIFVDGLQHRIQDCHEFAREALGITADRMKRNYDNYSGPYRRFASGDTCWYAYIDRKVTSRPWIKCIILAIYDPADPEGTNYRVTCGPGQRVREVSIDHLRPYHGSKPIPQWWAEPELTSRDKSVQTDQISTV